MLNLIVAVGKNGAIGKDNRLLWHLPGDLPRFKELTMGHPIIMGRKTFESLPGMLPGRPHIVLTRDRAWAAAHPALCCYPSVTELLDALDPHTEYFIIGGGEVYRALLPYTDRLYLTEVDDTPAADTFFMQPDARDWICRERRSITAGDTHPAYDFATYVRRADN